MAKFCGKVGYATTTQTSVGVWEEVITEKTYYGDILKYNSDIRSGENLNDNVRLTNRFSIVADAYAYSNFYNIRYVEWMNVKWKVTSIEVARPRLILSVGGEYNVQQN